MENRTELVDFVVDDARSSGRFSIVEKHLKFFTMSVATNLCCRFVEMFKMSFTDNFLEVLQAIGGVVREELPTGVALFTFDTELSLDLLDQERAGGGFFPVNCIERELEMRSEVRSGTDDVFRKARDGSFETAMDVSVCSAAIAQFLKAGTVLGESQEGMGEIAIGLLNEGGC